VYPTRSRPGDPAAATGPRAAKAAATAPTNAPRGAPRAAGSPRRCNRRRDTAWFT